VRVLDNPEDVMRAKLDDGEQLLWSGRPRRGVLLQPSDALLIPFSLFWGGFALFWEYEVVNTHQFWVLQIWGIPFVLIGLYLIAGRFFVDAYVRGRTYYGVTDKRVMVASGQTTRTIALSDLTGVALSTRPDGSGTIVFGPPGIPPPASTLQGYVVRSGRVQYPMFQMIPDAQSVFDTIQAHRTANASA
jgi:hypothetical protein